MKKSFYIYLHGEGEPQATWLQTGTGGGQQVGMGELREAALLAQGHRIVVVVPAHKVVITETDLPLRQIQRLRQAVPYALEERFAEDVDILHFALGQRDAAGQIPVAVVARAQMEQWRQQLEEVDLRPQRMVPLQLILPRREGEWSLLLEPGMSCLRSGANSGTAMPEQSWQVTLALAFKQNASEGQPTTLRLLHRQDHDVPDTIQGLPAGVEIAHENYTHLGELFTEADQTDLDLLQGNYSRKEQIERLWRPWRAVAALMIVWLGLEGGYVVHDYLQLKQRKGELYEEIVAVYRETFPDARRIVDPRIQMEQALQQLQSAGTGSRFIGLLTTAGPILKAHQGLELQSLRYHLDTLELTLILPDLATLDQLKTDLVVQGLEVEIASASSSNNRVESRLSVRRST